jgi:hypothetical protein
VCTKMKKSLGTLVNKNPNDYVEEENIDEDDETDDDDSTEKNKEIINEKKDNIAAQRETNQAEQMLAKNKKLISSFDVGDIVLAKMNYVDLGSADAPNIVCIILEKVDDKMFRLGHTSGIIAECFSFHVLTRIDNSAFNLKIEDIPDKEVTLREAIRSLSIANGQGFIVCNCVTGTCGKGTRCTCFKSGLKCNSRCHKGGLIVL